MPQDPRASANALTALKRNGPRLIFFSAMCFVLLAVVIVRVSALGLPLERDEGEFAYMGQLMLEGVPPYLEACGQKLPGIYAAYAAIMTVFSHDKVGIHLGLLLVNLAAASILFFIGMDLCGVVVASVAAASYAALSTDSSVLGLAAHATQFVVLFALAGIKLLLGACRTEKPWFYFLSGTMFGLAFLMKQPGLLFGLFGALALFLNWRRDRDPIPQLVRSGSAYLSAMAIPPLLVCLLLYKAGVFQRFWFWTVNYARAYASNLTFHEGWQLFLSRLPLVCSRNLILWFSAAIGFAVLIISRDHRKHRFFVILLLGFSALALSAGFYFRQHYFVLVLPAASLLIGTVFERLYVATAQFTKRPALASALICTLFLTFTVPGLWQQYRDLEAGPPDRVSHAIYGPNPFPEAEQAAKYIKANSAEFDRVVVIGSEPEIYFYSGRRSATCHLYMYPLFEPHRYARQMQTELIKDVETAKPRYLVFVDVFSWLGRDESERMVYDWAQRYVRDNYVRVMVAEIGAQESRYFWGRDAREHVPERNRSLTLYEVRR